jgi:adenine-specific DNA-methyltransferase
MVTKMEAVYKSYYTKSDPIVQYMVDQLSLQTGLRVFEPCAGDGVFIDALNGKVADLSIDIYELNPDAVELLRAKYGSLNNVKVRQADTLTSKELLTFSNFGGAYDRVIGNPPYGGWLDYEQRKYLKGIYPGLYVKETYTLFLHRCIQLLRDKGILVFIVPDTFLNLHMHTQLREYLLTNAKIREICLFPSSFFPGVNFGYSNLCIITLEKSLDKHECFNTQIRVITNLRSVEELKDLGNTIESHHQVFTLRQEEMYKNTDHALFIAEDTNITDLITHCRTTVGDIANCVTGFYSGNDKQYLHPVSTELKNANKYQVIDPSRICKDYVSKADILNGINGSRHFIPIVKGGAIKYLKPDLWYMDWSSDAVKNYKTNKKARFQNPQYYFKYGIGVPMISSSQMTASLIEGKLFDQSIVGIFPKNPKLLYYLLAFFNSPTCNRLIRTINPSANNPANYIKKIPFVHPSDKELKQIDKLVLEIVTALKNNSEYPSSHEMTLNNLIAQIYQPTDAVAMAHF